jgi:HEAT repeat protein
MVNKDQIVSDALRGLGSEDPSRRQAAAKALFKEARMEYTAARRDALGRDEVIAGLRTALADGDPVVVESAVGALAMIFSRYRSSAELYDDFLRLTKSPRKLTRLWAATGVARMDRDDRWQALKPLLADKNAEVRGQICRMFVDGIASGALRRQDAEQLIPIVEGLTSDTDAAVRSVATNTVASLKTVK